MGDHSKLYVHEALVTQYPCASSLIHTPLNLLQFRFRYNIPVHEENISGEREKKKRDGGVVKHKHTEN